MAAVSKKTTKRKLASSKMFTLEDGDRYKFRCTACGKEYVNQRGNFNRSPSPYYEGNGGFLHICKRCLEKTFIYYCEDIFDGDQDKAMELLCATINTSFNETAWASAKLHPAKDGKLGTYFSKLNLYHRQGRSYADTIKNRVEKEAEKEKQLRGAVYGGQSLQDTQENDETSNDSENTVDIETMQRFGFGFNQNEYDMLKFEYEDWVCKYGEPEDKRHDELYKSICYLKLQLQKGVQNGDNGIGALAKAYKEYINAATTELEDRKQKKEDSVKLDPLGVWISEIEKYTPAEFYKNKSLCQDYDNIGSYASRFIFRPLKNLLTGSKETDREFSLADSEG